VTADSSAGPSVGSAADLSVEPLDAVLRAATARLAAAGVAGARADAEQLAGHVLGLGRGQVAAAALAGRSIGPVPLARFEELLSHRVDRVPLQHLTGRAAFRTLDLRVGPGVFVPRPETEVVAGLAIEAAIEAAIEQAGDAGRTPLVVDLCTGSAAIAIAVSVEVPSARVVAVEREPHAHAWARRNVDELAAGRVDLRLGDAVGSDSGVLADLAGLADIVVANPPYIPAGARPVDPEVAGHDPPAALFGGGQDGLTVPRGVVRAAAGLLRPGGLLVMEHADSQGAATRALAAGPLWRQAATVRDLTGRDRALTARRAGVQGASQVPVRDFGP
jgi:release factor glutamine methyltransferase